MKYARYILSYFPVENHIDDQLIDQYVKMIEMKGGRVLINSRDFAPQLSIRAFFNRWLHRQDEEQKETGTRKGYWSATVQEPTY